MNSRDAMYEEEVKAAMEASRREALGLSPVPEPVVEEAMEEEEVEKTEVKKGKRKRDREEEEGEYCCGNDFGRVEITDVQAWGTILGLRVKPNTLINTPTVRNPLLHLPNLCLLPHPLDEEQAHQFPHPR
jgi:hypothetical protein